MRRPEGVTIVAMWFFLSASVCVLGLGALAIGLLGIWSQHSFQDIIFGTMGMMLAVVAVSALAVAYGVTSWALWRLKPWARSASIVLAILQLIVIPIGTIAGISILVYLQRNQEAKAAFGVPPKEPRTSPPAPTH
ncbi:MAG TPA: hypothetical protein VFP10_13840 [Candidatus Eisenbacteria bacterium]|nr:hypothetical protein [Candidatus Eisenbacteria bacterium]